MGIDIIMRKDSKLSNWKVLKISENDFSVFKINIKRIFYLIISLISILTDCTWSQKIEREIKPIEKYDVYVDEKKSAVVYDKSFNIRIEPLDAAHWNYFLNFDRFINKNSVSSIWRAPKLIFFHIIFENNGDNQISIKDIKLIAKNSEYTLLTLKDFKEKYKSPLYSMFNFKTILYNKRLFKDDNLLEKIDFSRDAIDYKFNFICPGDRISKIIFFDWIPVDIRSFKIALIINTNNYKKSAEFNFKRFEYRSSGPFSKPKKEGLE